MVFMRGCGILDVDVQRSAIDGRQFYSVNITIRLLDFYDRIDEKHRRKMVVGTIWR